MEFLRFIFSGFWVWLGFVILVSVIGGGVTSEQVDEAVVQTIKKE